MDVKVRKLRFWIDFATTWWNLCHVIADQTVCSEYLVSGFYGVDDSALNASSSKPSFYGGILSPQNARLYIDGKLSAWCPNEEDTQPYIQVRFPRETVVDTVILQGRGGNLDWVKTYYISYSIDGNTWTIVTSQNNQPKIFTGNYDNNTLVKSNLVSNITARYLRIFPQSKNSRNCLRFDLSGCYKVMESERNSDFIRVPVLPTPDYKQRVVLQTKSKNLPACGKLCHMDKECRFFNFDMIQKKCSMFSSMHTIYTAFSAEMTPFFVNKGKYTPLGYRQIQQGRFMYKVNEVRMNQESASKECMQQHSWLIKIDSASDMLSLQNVIAGNVRLELGYSHLFVSGRYLSMKWQHNDGSAINSSLWSPGNPDPGQGHCVVMTPNGLVSAYCLEKHFSVCGF
ncbi:uncharacterized protein LOC132556343 [Ylistrum balloti]|uniref:uncharacterized protein LOC132556343 n=1 Tax=Ylistrum balloti TaxID=509963 RepID=UPI0029058620|nr:uncharacterized protein LOC132556343 [Ylistrum balloti]